MEWTNTSEGWRSGPYLIELLEPGQWGLYRTTQTEEGQVRRDPLEVAGSLRLLKGKADSVEEERRQSVMRKRRLAILLVAMIVFVAASPGSGAIAAIVTVGAFGAMLWAALKLAHTGGSRPWERLREMYQ